MMRVFNQIFCSQRITIERALGQYVRKWGIVWSPQVFNDLDKIPLVITACAHLHNLAVDRWLVEKFSETKENISDAGDNYCYKYPTPKLPKVPQQWYEHYTKQEAMSSEKKIDEYSAEVENLNQYTDEQICYELRNGYIGEIPIVDESLDSLQVQCHKNKNNKSKLRRLEYMLRIKSMGFTLAN